jgi:hypothetical protein
MFQNLPALKIHQADGNFRSFKLCSGNKIWQMNVKCSNLSEVPLALKKLKTFSGALYDPKAR